MIVPVLVRYLTEDLLTREDITRGFITFAAKADPESWMWLAAKHGTSPNDPNLVVEAGRELQVLLLEALAAKVDRLQAVAEATELLGP